MHFIALVCVDPKSGATVNDMLDPFDENSHCEFFDMQDELEEEFAQDRRGYTDIDSYAAEWHGYTEDEETGRWGATYNPAAKWDWWQVGGRWQGFLKASDGHLSDESMGGGADVPDGRYDACLRRDLDLSPCATDEQLEDCRERYEALVGAEAAGVAMEDVPDDVRWDEWDGTIGFTEAFPTLDDYLWYELGSCPAALVTLGGEWQEPDGGQWDWGQSARSKVMWARRVREELLALPEDAAIFAVDCHI